jgi:hypothetical protein
MVGSSRILVAPGVRTLAPPGWRSGVAASVAAVSAQPELRLLGILGFCLRGGVLLLTMPMLVLPTQVEVRLLLGDSLGSTGFTPGFWVAVAIIAVLAGLATVGVLLVLARIELVSFERLVAAPEGLDHSAWLHATRPIPDRRLLFLRLFVVQALTFTALIAAAIPLASAVGQTAFDEVIRPSSSAPIYGRVFDAVGGQLYVFVIALIVVEVISSGMTRELLVRAIGWRGQSRGRLWLAPALAAALARPFRSPLRTLATAVLGWLATLAVLVPALWALSISFGVVRGAFLTSVSLSDVAADIGMALVAFGLCAVFVLALALAGIASAFRAALWSVDRLR